MINRRGAIVVIITSLCSVWLGYAQADRAWHADQLGMICKGDRLK